MSAAAIAIGTAAYADTDWIAAMRTLLVSPFPRSFLLLSKLFGGVSVALLQVYAFVFVAYFWEIKPPPVTEVRLFTFYDPPAWLAGVVDKMTDPIITPLFSVPELLQPFAGYLDSHPGTDPGGADAGLACPLHIVGHPPT